MDQSHLEKLTVAQLVNKFLPCYKTKMFITVFTKEILSGITKPLHLI
jgi:hypothetical protein